VLVLGGGLNTVDSISKAVEKGTPVVIFNVKKFVFLILDHNHNILNYFLVNWPMC
jgi:hypothetical protein